LTGTAHVGLPPRRGRRQEQQHRRGIEEQGDD
jgi:hypothetical protein